MRSVEVRQSVVKDLKIMLYILFGILIWSIDFKSIDFKLAIMLLPATMASLPTFFDQMPIILLVMPINSVPMPMPMPTAVW